MKRKTISAAISDLEGNYNRQLWVEAARAADHADVNLVAFEGRSIDNPGTELQHNIVYDLLRRFPADGYYVLSSQIGNYVGDVRIREFCAPLVATGRPVLSSGTEVPGTTSLLVDNRSGMSSLMDHLI
ncbi:MAG: hypothetical protein KBA30_09945, partial [Clostridia bacterium]|nr:hypothetical protein [Clostridia bacterium]